MISEVFLKLNRTLTPIPQPKQYLEISRWHCTGGCFCSSFRHLILQPNYCSGFYFSSWQKKRSCEELPTPAGWRGRTREQTSRADGRRRAQPAWSCTTCRDGGARWQRSAARIRRRPPRGRRGPCCALPSDSAIRPASRPRALLFAARLCPLRPASRHRSRSSPRPPSRARWESSHGGRGSGRQKPSDGSYHLRAELLRIPCLRRADHGRDPPRPAIHLGRLD